MSDLPLIEDAWLAVEDGIIVDYGSMKEFPGISDWNDLEVVDASGKIVLPTWVDSHTHLVFATGRQDEWVMRLQGKSYEEIAKAGGGILNSAKRLRGLSEDELYEKALTRLNDAIRMGTGAIEIKSGYGLDLDSEMKMLNVVQRLKEASSIPIRATFLGAHAVPEEHDANSYFDLVVNEMLPEVAPKADYVDIFCEEGYFTSEQTRRLLEEGKKLGLKGKIHVNQFTVSGGLEVAVSNGALSVDHLEVMGDEEYEILAKGDTLAVGLPACSLFLSIPYTPVRRLMDMDIPVVLASDFNPGSSPTSNMNLVVALGCIKMRMLPEEAINAATMNAAYALELEEEVGSITVGKKANFIVTKELPHYHSLPYGFGDNHIESVYINGIRQS